MRVERLGGDKIRFFLTLDDLADRGIEREDMWRDIPKVHELFHDMMEHAYQELGFEAAGPIAVEVHALPAQGMVVVVTRGRSPDEKHDDYDYDDSVYELEVTLEETEDVIFRFADFEDLIHAAIRVHSLVKQGGRVYAYQNGYYLVFGNDLKTEDLETMIAILSEFGEVSTATEPFLQEYGKTIFDQQAINQIVQYFG